MPGGAANDAPGDRLEPHAYVEVDGDPTQPGGYELLDDQLKSVYQKTCGSYLHITCVFVDGGAWTESVATFARARQQRSIRILKHDSGRQFVLLCRGRTTEDGRVVYRPKKTEANWRGATIARSVGVWGVGTNSAKTLLFGRMQSDGGVDDEANRMMHFPSGLPPEYFIGLTSEYFDLRMRRWVKRKGARNEPVDVLVYAYAAALSPHVAINKISEHEWASLEARLEPAPDLFTTPLAELGAQAIAKPAPARPGVRTVSLDGPESDGWNWGEKLP